MERMYTIDAIRRRLKNENHSAIGREVGMTRQHVWQVLSGKIENPSARTVEVFSRCAEKIEKGHKLPKRGKRK